MQSKNVTNNLISLLSTLVQSTLLCLQIQATQAPDKIKKWLISIFCNDRFRLGQFSICVIYEAENESKKER